MSSAPLPLIYRLFHSFQVVVHSLNIYAGTPVEPYLITVHANRCILNNLCGNCIKVALLSASNLGKPRVRSLPNHHGRGLHGRGDSVLETPRILRRKQRNQRGAAREPDELAHLDQTGLPADERLARGAEERHRSGRAHVARRKPVRFFLYSELTRRLYTTEQPERETHENGETGETEETGENGETEGQDENGERRGKAKQRSEESGGSGSGSTEPAVFIGECVDSIEFDVDMSF